MISSQNRTIIQIIFVVLLIGAALKLADLFKTKNIEAGDASRFVLEDLKNRYPGANIAILNVTEKRNPGEDKYFEVKAKVTKLFDTLCPERLHVYYNYPAQNFIVQPDEIITKNCKVCQEQACIIAFEEEAIIASHKLPGTERVQLFLRNNLGAFASVEERENVWAVLWSTETETYEVRVRKNGTVANISAWRAG